MLYREIIAVCSQVYTKHINTLCGQNVELLNVKLAVHIVTTGFKGLNLSMKTSQLTETSYGCQIWNYYHKMRYLFL